MTLYYALVFALLVFEMLVFCLLVLPLPQSWRRSLVVFINTSPLVAKLHYSIRITFIFILVLFIDSVNRVFKVQDYAQEQRESGLETVMREAHRSDVSARKFYAQRNMYLTGFTLFLSLILNRTFALLTEMIRLQDLVKSSKTAKTDSVKVKAYEEEISELRAKLKRRDDDFDELADKYKQETSTAEAKKAK
ncbi:Endoplasmic reticulum transmembrane protein 3 [Savitreella phatthalungensis]